MRITKIKIKQDRVFIEYDKVVVVNNEELLNKYSINSPEQPTSAFKKAFQAMDFYLVKMCELCNDMTDLPVMCEDVTITGLSFKYTDGELAGAVITGTKALAFSNSPLILNTPLKLINVDSDFDRMIHLTDTCISGLKTVLMRAEDYVNGERLQVEMDLKDSADISDDVKVTQNEEDPNFGKGDEAVSERISDSKIDGSKEADGLPDFEDDDINKDVRDEDAERIKSELARDGDVHYTDGDFEIPKVP